MPYIDGMVAAVPTANRAQYLTHATAAAALFRKHGAVQVVETWGNDVPDGKLTSFPMAVKKADDETVVFSWIVWPSKESHDTGWAGVMAEWETANVGPMPFDGKRMIYGGFEVLLDA